MSTFRFSHIRRNPTLWTILLLVILLVAINVGGWYFYRVIYEILDEELGRRLQSLDSIATLLLDKTQISELVSDSPPSTTQSRVNEELYLLRDTMKLGDLYIINQNYHVLARAESAGIAHPLRLLDDKQEIDSAFHGKITEGFHYFVGNTWYKRAYAPIYDEKSNIIAVLGVEASAEYFQMTDKIFHYLVYLGLLSIVLIGITMFILNRIFTAMFRLEERVLSTDKLQSLTQLSAGVAHEIRNPLGIISGNAELLNEEMGDDKQKKELVQNIISESDRLEKIIRNFLEFSKPGSLESSEQDINQILDKTLQLCQHQLQKEGVVVTKEYEKDLPKIKMDSQRMTQVFLNLILNAREALLQGGWLTVRSFARDNKSVIVEIQDSGMGIPSEIVNKIFEPFYTTKKTGSGLGLPIAKRIIEDHHGKIEIQSEHGKGTTVRVILPIK